MAGLIAILVQCAREQGGEELAQQITTLDTLNKLMDRYLVQKISVPEAPNQKAKILRPENVEKFFQYGINDLQKVIRDLKEQEPPHPRDDEEQEPPRPRDDKEQELHQLKDKEEQEPPHPRDEEKKQEHRQLIEREQELYLINCFFLHYFLFYIFLSLFESTRYH